MTYPSAASRVLGCLFLGLLLGWWMNAAAASAAEASEPRWFGAGAEDAGAPPYPQIPEPVDSWVYDELERQLTLGHLDPLPVHSRPIPRTVIAQRVAQALAEGRRSLGLLRLAREFAWETRMMGLETPYRDSRPWVTLGPPSSFAKFNGLISAGAELEGSESPRVGDRAVVGFRGQFWQPPRLGLFGEYLVTDVEDAATFGDPVFGGTDIQFTTPRFAATVHGAQASLWAGRDQVRWGPGRSGGLLAGGGADPVTQVGYRVSLGRLLTATAVHGWLSQAERRYVAFHRIELDLGRGLRVGVGEGVRYDAGSPEPMYLVNLIPYAAVERLLTSEGHPQANRDSLFRSNYIAAADVFWRLRPGVAVYGELMVDDVKTAEVGPSRMAYQVGGLWVREGARRLSLQAEWTRIYNYTYRVFYGRDFLHRDDPLGHPLGPDAAEVRVWAELDWDVDWTLGLEVFHTRRGEGNGAGPWCPETLLGNNPFGTECQDFGEASGRDMAGTVERRAGFLAGATFRPRDNLTLAAAAGAVRVENLRHAEGVEETRPLARLQASWRW